MKNIVLCFDGTDGSFGPAPFSNALKVFRLLDRQDPLKQICYYQPGIGASMRVEDDSIDSSLQGVTNQLDSLVAYSLDKHIKEAYRYMMQFYEDGDTVFMFGFSRGAFTARVLCSMIDRVGLLNKGLEEIVDGAWSIYSAWEYAAQPSQPDYTTTLVDEFQKTFSRPKLPKIEFLGLFDCVNSVGLIRDRMFPFTTKFKSVKKIRHAVSLDERRAKYKQNLIFPNPYEVELFQFENPTDKTPVPIPSNSSRPTPKEENDNGWSEELSILNDARKMASEIEQSFLLTPRKKSDGFSSTSSFDSNTDEKGLLNCEFQELWFPGDHSDLGGGWSPDFNGQFISNLPLRWIISEAIVSGVRFQKQKVVEFAQRYSSIDSFLSCSHDTLSLWSSSLTHELSSREQSILSRLANPMADKHKSGPFFRSCEVPKSIEDSTNGGMKTVNLRFNSKTKNIADFKVISEIFSHYKELPSQRIRATDGRGNNPIWRSLAWWTIEFLPLSSKIEDKVDKKWRFSLIPNLGQSRKLPKYAKLHWSIYWRLKYTCDYRPVNFPDYVFPLLKEYFKESDLDEYFKDGLQSKNEPINVLDDDEGLLLKRVKDETRKNLRLWDLQEWKVVPDDLLEVLKRYGFTDEASPP